ncbi:cofilin family protein [Streptomyces sp. NPDC088762]|uniref:cofilin family protein n=1 Tax=Streptomyces sp. NPDC088762 TaxID=3365891 RepID=UPI003814524E
MSSPIAVSDDCLHALHRLRERRDVNTVILRHDDAEDTLVLELEGNLTHDEVLQALPPDEPRLLAHELSFATSEGMRRNERLLIFWCPAAAGEQGQPYSAGRAVLEELLEGTHLRLQASQREELEYGRLVGQVG